MHKNIIYLYNNFANVNCRLEDYLTALKYYQKVLNLQTKDNNINEYIEAKINITATLLEMGHFPKAKLELEKLFDLVNNKSNTINQLIVLMNLLELNIELNNKNEIIKIYSILNDKYKLEAIKEYPFEFKLSELKIACLIDNTKVDSLYNDLINMKLNEYNINLTNFVYGKYLLNTQQIAKGTLILDSTLNYYNRISNTEKALEINTLLLKNISYNADSYKSLISKYNNLIFKQKKNLFYTLEQNDLLINKLLKLEIENTKTKYLNIILYILLLSTFLFIIIMYVYFKLKNQNKLNLNNYKTLQFKINNIEFNISNNIRELQEIIYTKSEVTLSDIKNQNNNLLNLIKNLRK